MFTLVKSITEFKEYKQSSEITCKECRKLKLHGGRCLIHVRQFPTHDPRIPQISGNKTTVSHISNGKSILNFVLAPCYVIQLLLFITRKYSIINANLKFVNAKIHLFYSIDIH